MSGIGDTRKNCKFVFQQPCRCPTNQLEATKFSKVISKQQNNSGGESDQTCCYICCGIFAVVTAMPLFILIVFIIIIVVVIVLCCMCEAEDGHSSLEILYKCPTCGKETHRIYECFIDISYNWVSGRRGETFTYRNQTYSVWGQYTENVTKTVVQCRMTMNNFEAVERKFDVMSVVQTDNYYKTSDEWTDDLIRRLE
ncbi:hypothetical protein niasHS_007884 [Heterodera schachtii]|uniref:Uncharacterized protein n=1 Tax=Heterodera schachtii TaxID=97005 RepID=A0ABD2JPX3_HETSC